MSKLFVDTIEGNTGNTIAINDSVSTLKTGTIQSAGGTTAMSINTGGQILMPTRPAFDAAPTSSIAHGTNPIPMANVRINNGGHFNSSNGTFTAPINGTYFFFMNWIGGTATTVFRFYARYNGNVFNETHARLDSSAGNDYNASSLQWIKTMSANETMAVSYQADDNSSAAYSDANQGYQGFGGFLLY